MLDAFSNNWTILVVSFFIYSFCGWIWESLVCHIATGHKIHNSGFLTGPCIPIYGSGAIVVCALFPVSKDWSLIFIEGAIVACFIEYLTSYFMEKMFHARWWDGTLTVAEPLILKNVDYNVIFLSNFLS